MNKKVLIFSLYCVIIIVALILFLVFFPSNSADSATDNNNNTQVDTPNVDNPSTDNITYATLLTLNCPRSITIPLGESCELLGQFISVEPQSCFENLSYTITGRYGSSQDGIEFSDNIITTKKTGTYYLKFSVPSSEKENLTDGIQISVVEDSTTNIIQLVDNLEIGIEYKLEEIFTFNTQAKINIMVDNIHLTYENNIFQPKTSGESKIEIGLIYEYIKYNYTYIVQIKEKPLPPDYIIEINLTKTEFNVGEIYPIEYAVLDKNGVTAYQYVKVESSNSDIVEITSSDYPLIYIKCKEQGEVIITITYTIDTSISTQIKLIVK